MYEWCLVKHLIYSSLNRSQNLFCGLKFMLSYINRDYSLSFISALFIPSLVGTLQSDFSLKLLLKDHSFDYFAGPRRK